MRRTMPESPRPDGAHQSRPAFTLVEVLVVLLIILIATVAAVGLYRGTGGRQVDEAARLLQASLAGARDQAIRTGRPSGVRLMVDTSVSQLRPDGTPDPAGILAANRLVPIAAAPDYSDGQLAIYRDARGGSALNYSAAIRTVNGYPGVPCLVLESSVLDASGAPNPPTNWFWNIRVGDRIQINQAGPWYTIVGPMTTPNPELFVNVGPPGSALPTLNGPQPCEYLLLVNGRDDNGNGWVDEGWDGVDNDGNGTIDDAGEWEAERWPSP